MSLPHAGRGQCWCGGWHNGLTAMLAELQDAVPPERTETEDRDS